ncbi:uncharacterized protein LOC108193930 isoform X1 [Daucus carota subsp. sativus]|uniref:uncharacterized protein LOC108193930 isoform X1 n=1 Tax=Daucus carota subsp. sativus TaxID=79200 RepID=UPI003083B71D
MEKNSYHQAGYPLLPSELLTDHNHNQSLQASDNHQLPTEFPYDFASFTCPPHDNQEDDFFTGLTRQFALSTLLDSNKLQYPAVTASQAGKKWRLSSSPQSVLGPVFSNGSPTGPLHGPSSPTGPFSSTDYSWDLIHEAAGQVNTHSQLKNQQALRTQSALLRTANSFPPHRSSSSHQCYFVDNHLKSHCDSIWEWTEACQKGGDGNVGCRRPNARSVNPHGLFNVNGVGVDSSLFFPGRRKNSLGNECGAFKRKCAGTGVFLPRRGPDPVQSRPKFGNSAAEAMNIKYGARFAEDVLAADVIAMRRNAVLAQQWRNEVKMMMAAASCKGKWDTLPE